MTRFYQTIILCGLLAAAGWWGISQLNSNETKQIAENQTSSFEGEENEENKRINAQKRLDAEFEILKDPKTGKIPPGIHLKSVEAALRVPQFQLKSKESDADDRAIPSITITSRGPNNYGGRTRALGFDTRNNDIVLAGGVTSGIYRSTNGGAGWTRVTPAGVIHSLNCLAQDTRNGQEDTWYAGTGEASSSAGGTGASYLGFGIYKSTDNGLTWSALANTQTGDLETYDNDFDHVSRIVVDPTNGNVIAAVASAIYRSTDGGTNWTKVLGPADVINRTDVIYNSVSGKFYAAIHGQASSDAGIWESTSGASGTWTQTRTPAQLNGSISIGRIILANVANLDDIVVMYELLTNFTCSNANTTKAGLQHYDGTSTWTDHTDKVGNCTDEYTAGASLPTQLVLQGGYNMALTTKPNDANIVFIAGTEGYRYNLSTNAYEFIGGSQAAANSVNLHVDQHIFMFEPGSNDVMWAGNDGGLRETDVTGTITATIGNDDNGYTWTPRSTDYNGYQYYGADIDPSNSTNFVAGGAQDNAFTIQPTGAAALEVGPTADGVDVGIISGGSDFNTHNFFQMWQEGSMQRFENGSAATGTINPDDTDFKGHFYLDADNTNYLYFPSITPNALYRTRIAESINATTVTGDPTTGWENMTGVNGAIGGKISAMDASRDIQHGGNYSTSDADRRLYIGTANGEVFRLNDPAFVAPGTAPVDITPTGMTAGGNVSDIAVNPLDDKEILVTYSNYGVNSVWHTSDASVAMPTWTNVEGASGSAVELASSRCAMITLDQGNKIYMVGTSTGIYATDALSGATTS